MLEVLSSDLLIRKVDAAGCGVVCNCDLLFTWKCRVCCGNALIMSCSVPVRGRLRVLCAEFHRAFVAAAAVICPSSQAAAVEMKHVQ